MNLDELHIGDIIIADDKIGFYNGKRGNVYYVTSIVSGIGIKIFGAPCGRPLLMSEPFTFIHSSVTDDVKYQ